MHLIGQTPSLYRLRKHPPIQLSATAQWRQLLLKIWMSRQAAGSSLRCPGWDVTLVEAICELRQLCPHASPN